MDLITVSYISLPHLPSSSVVLYRDLCHITVSLDVLQPPQGWSSPCLQSPDPHVISLVSHPFDNLRSFSLHSTYFLATMPGVLSAPIFPILLCRI